MIKKHGHKNKLKWHISPLLILMIVVLVSFGLANECVAYIVTIVMHELAHAEVSNRLGYTLTNFRLMPYGVALTGEFEGMSSADEVKIALAGPLCNFVMAVLCAALWWIFPSSYVLTYRLAESNIFTALFNLLPVFPMDGGRALLAIVSVYVPRERAYQRLRIVGYVLSGIFLAAFVVFIFYGMVNISFCLVGGFMLISTVIPDKNSQYRRLYGMAFMSERIKHGLQIRRLLVSENTTLLEMSRMLNSGYYTEFRIVDSKMNSMELSETDLDKILTSNPLTSKIKDVL